MTGLDTAVLVCYTMAIDITASTYAGMTMLE